MFVVCNCRGTAIKVLVYDDYGLWLCHKRLSKRRSLLLQHEYPFERIEWSLKSHEASLDNEIVPLTTSN